MSFPTKLKKNSYQRNNPLPLLKKSYQALNFAGKLYIMKISSQIIANKWLKNITFHYALRWLFSFLINYMLLIHVVHEKLRDHVLQLTYIPYAIPLLEHTLIISLLAVIHKVFYRFTDWFLSALLITPFWIMLDWSFRMTGVIPTWQAVKTHFWSWFEFMPMWTIIAVLIWICIVLIVIIVGFLQIVKKSLNNWNARLILFIKIIALLFLLYFTFYESNKMIKGNGIFSFKLHTIIPAYSLIDNGRMASFVLYSRYLEHQQQQMKTKKPNLEWQQIIDTLYSLQPMQKRNLYIILLESFIDARDLKGVTFNKNPIYPKFLQFLSEDTFYYAKSSYIGWGTAQTTFEVFTGVPAFHRYSDVEFAMFNAHPVPSVLQWLKQYGYSTAAFVAAGNDYYNMVNAYKSLGFDTTIFLKELPEYRDLLRVMDSTLYKFGLEYARSNLKPPFLLYFVTMYEHWPWYENPPAGDSVITVEPSIPEVEFIANATFWRTKDLYNLISNILKMDSSAIILLYGDHTPPKVKWEGITYRKPHDAVPFVIINAGKTIKVKTHNPYIPFYIINRILYQCLISKTCTEISVDSLYKDSTLYSIIYDDLIKYGFSGLEY